GTGLIITNPEGMKFTYALRFRFDATNNEAKYKALIDGLKIAEQMVVKNLKANDVQKLNGKLKSLNEFLAKSADKSLPFFKMLKKCTKISDFRWTAEAEEAFKQMKQLIAELTVLAAPMEKDELIVYLAATKETVSAT
nr:reverse transcriptase domain-containing protein [Tanacetum cinerariifolium]